MRPLRVRKRQSFVNQTLHLGRKFGRRTDAFFRHYGPTIRQASMMAAPMLAETGLPQVAAATVVLGPSGGYAQLRDQLGD